MGAVSRDNAEHYVWGDNCDGWHLLGREDLSVIQESMRPSTSEVAHYHARSRQFFFVLSGILSIQLDSIVHALGPEQGLEVPAGQVHRVYNDSTVEVRFLVISSPPAQADRVAVPLQPH